MQHSVRYKNKPRPIYEEFPNNVETEEENEDRPFHVITPTTAESQAARNRPQVSFRHLPEIIEQDTESEIENTLRDESIAGQALPQLTVYEEIPGNDSEKSESEQNIVRNDEPERRFDTDRDS